VSGDQELNKETGALTVGHFTVTQKSGRIDAACSKCGQGINVGVRFGVIPGEILLTAWAKQHLHKPKTRRTKPSASVPTDGEAQR
jgi:hypothetical protein